MPTEPPKPTHIPSVEHRIPQLDGLRAVAMLAVFFHHSARIPLLWTGVDVFFVLSGFLITGILLHRKQHPSYFGYFYIRRAFRILPPYIVVCLAVGALVSWKMLTPWPFFVFFGMNIHDFLYGPTPLLPVWSLAVEEQFYLVWPFIVLLSSERVILIAAAVGVFLTPLLRVAATPLFASHFPIYFLTPFRADLLCAGAVIAMLWKNQRPRIGPIAQRFAWIGFVVGFGLLAFLQLHGFRLIANTRKGNGLDYSLSLIGSASLLLWALGGRGWLVRFLSLRPVRYLGQISYFMYLTHIAFLHLCKHWFTDSRLVSTVGLLCTFAAAALSWHLMERPLIRLAARLAPGLPNPPPPV